MRANSLSYVLTLMLMTAWFSILPVESRAKPMCEISVAVTNFNSTTQPEEVYRSVDEAFAGRNQSSPFMTFALEVEEALVAATARNLCTDGESDKSISFDLTVVELAIASKDEQLERLRSRGIGTRGSYVELTVDQENSSVDATIIWNPRRMLRDQLILEGWELSQASPLLPFSQSEFSYWVDRYISDVLIKRPSDAPMVTQTLIQDGLPKDLSGLLTNNIQTTRVPFGSLVLSNVEKMQEASTKGYTAMALEAITRSFIEGSNEPIKSVSDVGDHIARSLYQDASWNLLEFE